jgi:hypothetical protein
VWTATVSAGSVLPIARAATESLNTANLGRKVLSARVSLLFFDLIAGQSRLVIRGASDGYQRPSVRGVGTAKFGRMTQTGQSARVTLIP